jgi:hypothetical protein
MSELKTQPHGGSVEAFLDGIEPEGRREDCRAVAQLMREVTDEEPTLWRPGIVGFGSYHYRYESGREGDWFLTGFASRKQALTLYIMAGFPRFDELMGRLGKYKTGKSCLYVKRLDDIDLDVLRELVTRSVEHMRATYPSDPS